MDRRDAASGFRDRLLGVLTRRGMTQSAFARATGVDRSTLAQLLSDAHARLPRAETLAAISIACGVSTDWLLGLSSEETAAAGEGIGEVMSIEPHEGSPIDDRMFAWMTEAAGAKIRTVPVSFPDLLKTEAVLHHEYHHAAGDAPRSWENVESRLAYLHRPETEIEACACVQALEELAAGRGIWTGLSATDRAAQLDRLGSLCDDLYPSFRLFLFDRRRSYSVPFTVFGASRAALFVGGIYFVYTWTGHIRALVRRFDVLVREAVVQPPDIGRFAQALKAGAGLDG